MLTLADFINLRPARSGDIFLFHIGFAAHTARAKDLYGADKGYVKADLPIAMSLHLTVSMCDSNSKVPSAAIDTFIEIALPLRTDVQLGQSGVTHLAAGVGGMLGEAFVSLKERRVS